MNAHTPDTIWETAEIAGHRLRIGRPNYDKPGVRERIAREAFEAQCIARPFASGLYGLIQFNQAAERLEGQGRA